MYGFRIVASEMGQAQATRPRALYSPVMISTVWVVLKMHRASRA